jgi:hypothetical protein
MLPNDPAAASFRFFATRSDSTLVFSLSITFVNDAFSVTEYTHRGRVTGRFSFAAVVDIVLMLH